MTAKQEHYFKVKGRISIIDATRKAYDEMPGTFYGSQIHSRVCRLTLRPGVFPDSVIRKMRLLRMRHEIDFKCVDQVESKYQKI